MIALPIDEIKECLKSIGAGHISVQQDPDKVMFISLVVIRKKPVGVFLVASEVGGQVLFQFFSTFEQAFEKPGLDFYTEIDRLNEKLAVGHVQVKEQDGDWHMTYRSNFIGEAERLFANDCFRNFVAFSVDMVGAIYKEMA